MHLDGIPTLPSFILLPLLLPNKLPYYSNIFI